MTIELCLIDGTYELFRAFYGAPRAVDEEGRERGATRALSRSLRLLLRQARFTHYGIAFDTVIESFRNELFDGYKRGDGIDPDLLDQFSAAEAAAEEQGFFVWRMIEFEADDALASAAAKFSKEPDVNVVIASPDKDLMQCVGPNVSCWDRLRDKSYDEEGVRTKLGVHPRAVPDYLALVGDSADGIPGVPTWGPKSSAALIGHYGSLEAIPLDSDQWEVKVRGAAGLAEQLRALQKEVRLYKQLATLRTDVDLGCSLGDLSLAARVD